MSRRAQRLEPADVRWRADARALERFGRVLMPEDRPEPILAPRTREALFHWLREIQHEDKLRAVNLAPRRRAMLFGPPGCGKTTLAHHLAARLGLPLLCVQSESIISKYVGDTEKTLGQLFDAAGPRACTKAPVALFFDEFDTLATKRKEADGGAVDARNAMVNTLLRRLDHHHGLVFAATNLRDHIDPAVWRRFDLHLDIDLPGPDEIFAILKMYGAPVGFDEVLIEGLAVCLMGASPALIKQVIEGLKRRLVLAPHLGLEIGSAAAELRAVAGAIEPPADFDIPLWRPHPLLPAQLEVAAWPPEV